MRHGNEFFSPLLPPDHRETPGFAPWLCFLLSLGIFRLTGLSTSTTYVLLISLGERVNDSTICLSIGEIAMYVDLDAKDRELLDILKRDARTPVTVLAEVLSLSRNTVQKRIDRLVNSGVIDGFTIRVNEQLQPDKIKALMSVELEGLSTTQLISKLRQVNGVERFHTTNGNWDLLIVITAESLAHLDGILKEVRGVKGVLNSETSIILSTTEK